MLNSSNNKRRQLFSGKRVMTMPEPINLAKSGCGSTTTRQSSSKTISPTSHFLLCLHRHRNPHPRFNLQHPHPCLAQILQLETVLHQTPSFNPIANLVNRLFHRLWHLLLSTIGTFSSFQIRRHSHHRFLPYQRRRLHSNLYLPKPKSTSSFSNVSLRVPKPLSFMSMSLANGLGRSVSGLLLRVYGTTTSGGPDSVVSAKMGT